MAFNTNTHTRAHTQYNEKEAICCSVNEYKIQFVVVAVGAAAVYFIFVLVKSHCRLCTLWTINCSQYIYIYSNAYACVPLRSYNKNESTTKSKWMGHRVKIILRATHKLVTLHTME